MNIRLATFLSGAPYLDSYVFRGGRRLPVLDRARRWRCVLRAMRKAGLSEIQIARRVGRSSAWVRRLLQKAPFS